MFKRLLVSFFFTIALISPALAEEKNDDCAHLKPFTGAIDAAKVEFMVLVLDTCFKEESGEIVMRITSDGGNATYGLAIYEMIRNAPSPVTTYAYGGVASAATMIFMAGKERIITCSSYLLIHEPYIEASAATTVTIAKSEQNTALLKFLYKRFIDVYTGVTKQPRDHIEKLVQNETILSSEEALKLGFATQRIGC